VLEGDRRGVATRDPRIGAEGLGGGAGAHDRLQRLDTSSTYREIWALMLGRSRAPRRRLGAPVGIHSDEAASPFAACTGEEAALDGVITVRGRDDTAGVHDRLVSQQGLGRPWFVGGVGC
jgi:hypothetical protein